MSDSALTALAVAALVVGVLALLVSVLALRGRSRARGSDSPLPTDVAGLRDEVERLRREAGGALRRLAVVRYDAFGDMGGRLSWSLALCDDQGDGVVLTSISGRSDARTYAKNVSGWACDQPLSPEEEEAVSQAKAAG
jgi:Protein of unknown function (DUF4446)